MLAYPTQGIAHLSVYRITNSLEHRFNHYWAFTILRFIHPHYLIDLSIIIAAPEQSTPYFGFQFSFIISTDYFYTLKVLHRPITHYSTSTISPLLLPILDQISLYHVPRWCRSSDHRHRHRHGCERTAHGHHIRHQGPCGYIYSNAWCGCLLWEDRWISRAVLAENSHISHL